jgi:hypothetical protein
MDGTSPKPPRMEESCQESQDSTGVVALTEKKKIGKKLGSVCRM